MVNAQRLDASTLGVLKTRRVGSIGNDHNDLGVEAPVTNSVGERKQIAAPPGNQNTEAAIHVRLM